MSRSRDCLDDYRPGPHRRAAGGYQGRRQGLRIAARAGAVVAKPKRRRRNRAVHARQHDARADGAGRQHTDGRPHPRRGENPGRGARQHLLPSPRHRENAPQARSPGAEAGPGGRGRKPRFRFGRDPALEATRAATETTRGVRMFFLELAQERPHSAATAAAPILGLDHVVVSTEDPERAAALYGARLGLDMALDRSHQDWGQLMFFRCGGLIVEVVRRPVAGADQTHDRLWGLSWRVADIDATRARLAAAGLDVSEVRIGRKPGTRVASVRDGTCGIHTLLVERTARSA